MCVGRVFKSRKESRQSSEGYTEATPVMAVVTVTIQNGMSEVVVVVVDLVFGPRRRNSTGKAVRFPFRFPPS